MLGDAILGDLILGSGSLGGFVPDPDDPIVIAIIDDIGGRISYLHASSVESLNEASYVELLSPTRSWVKLSK